LSNDNPFFFLSKKKGAAYVVASYATKLENEKSWRSSPGVTPLHDTSRTNYTYVQQQDDHGANVPLTNPYPYGGANNSFGGSTPHHPSRAGILAATSV
jgi:hypothetical protein